MWFFERICICASRFPKRAADLYINSHRLCFSGKYMSTPYRSPSLMNWIFWWCALQSIVNRKTKIYYLFVRLVDGAVYKLNLTSCHNLTKVMLQWKIHEYSISVCYSDMFWNFLQVLCYSKLSGGGKEQRCSQGGTLCCVSTRECRNIEYSNEKYTCSFVRLVDGAVHNVLA